MRASYCGALPAVYSEHIDKDDKNTLLTDSSRPTPAKQYKRNMERETADTNSGLNETLDTIQTTNYFDF